MWWLSLTCFVILASTTNRQVNACSCVMNHPQNLFCQSDFVGVMKVVGMNLTDRYSIAYKVAIQKLFKSDPSVKVAFKQNLLWTPSEDTMCGVTLDINRTYLIGGYVNSGKPSVSLCGLVKLWSDLSNKQRHAYRRLYRHACSCKVSFTSFTEKARALHSGAGKRCIWESFPGPQECQENYGTCMASQGVCSWVPTVHYKNCIASHQRRREMRKPQRSF